MKLVFGIIVSTFPVLRNSMQFSTLNSNTCIFMAVPSKDGETEELEVFNFEGAGGVALSMYNTDEVISSSIILPFIFCALCF